MESFENPPTGIQGGQIGNSVDVSFSQHGDLGLANIGHQGEMNLFLPASGATLAPVTV